MSPRSAVFALPCCEGFGEQPADYVAAAAAFFGGDGVDLGDRFGIEPDGVDVSRHRPERITPIDNVIQRDTVST